MDCTPQGLIELARCTDSCIPPGLMGASQIASACAWANGGGAPPCTLPTAPVDLGATFGYNQVTLTWPAGVGATGYNIKRALVSGGPYTVIGTSAASPYVDLTAVNFTEYYYVVSSTNACGESVGNSLESHATPGYLTDRWYFSNAIAAPGASFSIGFSGAGTRIVDWGDGNTDTTNGTLVMTHVYAAAGNYVFSSRESIGVTSRIYFGSLAGSGQLTGILTPPNGMTGINSLSAAFYNCAGLTGSIPSLSLLTSLTSLADTFNGCTGLTGSIPVLSVLTALTNMATSFYGCAGLTGSIPSLSACTALTTLSNTFFGCTGLTGSIPALSALTALTDLSYAFFGCTGLTGSIPALSACTALTTLSAAFYNCAGVTGSIPTLSALTALTDLSYTFNSCAGLTGSIPILSTLTGLANLTNAFYGCFGLVGNTNTVAQIFGGANYPNLMTANSCFWLGNAANSYLLGNAADFISLTKNAGFVVGTGAGDGSYQMFHNQITLTDYAATPADWK
jgi:hypothetical protein